MKLKYLCGIGIIAILILSGCKRNEKQIEQTWTVVKVTQTGRDVSADYIASGYKETYLDGRFSYSGQPGSTSSGSGDYNWNGKTSFKRNGVSGQPSVNCSIIKLDKDEFEYSFVNSGEEWIFTFKK